MSLKHNEYQCAKCGEVYEKGWSDEDAQKEAEELWTPEELASGIATICDDCFNNMME